MKVGVIIYYSNIFQYKLSWIKQCLKSIKDQTFTDYFILELNYGNDNISLLTQTKIFNRNKYCYSKLKLKNYIEAQNFLFKKGFEEYNFDIIFNINIDDYYEKTKFEKHIKVIQNSDAQIVSSNFKLFQEINNKEYYQDVALIKEKDIEKQNDILYSLFMNNDPKYFQNSGSCITKNFFLKSNKNIFQDFTLFEVLFMCKEMISKVNFYIIPENLCFQRLHKKQLSYKYR